MPGSSQLPAGTPNNCLEAVPSRPKALFVRSALDAAAAAAAASSANGRVTPAVAGAHRVMAPVFPAVATAFAPAVAPAVDPASSSRPSVGSSGIQSGVASFAGARITTSTGVSASRLMGPGPVSMALEARRKAKEGEASRAAAPPRDAEVSDQVGKDRAAPAAPASSIHMPGVVADLPACQGNRETSTACSHGTAASPTPAVAPPAAPGKAVAAASSGAIARLLEQQEHLNSKISSAPPPLEQRFVSDAGGAAAAMAPVPPPSTKPWHRKDYSSELLDFSNSESVELYVLCDQYPAQMGDDTLQWLKCSQGDVVSGMSIVSEPKGADLVWCVVYRDGARCEGIVPKTSCSPCGSYEFMMHVTTPPGTALGLRGSVHAQGLVVEEVKPGGIAEKWNNGCARTFMRNIIRAGDVIVSANGCRDLASLLSAFRGGCVAKLRFLRPVGSHSRIQGAPATPCVLVRER